MMLFFIIKVAVSSKKLMSFHPTKRLEALTNVGHKLRQSSKKNGKYQQLVSVFLKNSPHYDQGKSSWQLSVIEKSCLHVLFSLANLK